MYECAGWLRVRESVRYITHNSCAISVVPPFNKYTSYKSYSMTQRLWHSITIVNKLNIKKNIKSQYCDHSNTE